jgi:hypothetical protein
VLLQVFTIVALIVLAALLRRHAVSGFPFTVAAAVLFAIGLLVWWIFVYPVNVELAKWVNGPVPDNWADWRALWEWGQAANGLAQFVGFAALIASVLGKKAKRDKTKASSNSRRRCCHGTVANPPIAAFWPTTACIQVPLQMRFARVLRSSPSPYRLPATRMLDAPSAP